jgi:flavin-dependent dehydrogenase
MADTYDSDILIAGGGLAGLSLAILCADAGLRTILIEKQTYPKHKVCGEYLSVESVPFLRRIGIDLESMSLPQINHFVLTSSEVSMDCNLSSGGIGISRYTLDNLLYQKALEKGVDVVTSSRVTQINSGSELSTVLTHDGRTYAARQIIGGYGRISGLNTPNQSSKHTFLGIKYHVVNGPDDNTIEIHNFNGGYCGISAIEDGKFCMCYLVKAEKLKAYKGDIDMLEKEILAQNPYLKHRLNTQKLVGPISTAHFNFGTADVRTLQYPLLGDAAGFIPPVTGNGMSLALRSAQVLFTSFMNEKKGTFQEKWLRANRNYIKHYLKNRIRKGIFLQNILLTENTFIHKSLLYTIRYTPGLLPVLAGQATGRPF